MSKKVTLLNVLLIGFICVSPVFSENSTDDAAPAQTRTDASSSAPDDSGSESQTNSTQSSAVITDQKVYASVEKLNVDPTTGTATLSIPFNVPPGRAGIQPNIALLYNSSGGNSVAGVGWNFELGSIQRSTKRGVPNYNFSDTFVLTQSGSTQELVYDSAAGFYRMKIEGAFMRTEFIDNSYWIVTDKKGTKYFFGRTNASRLYDPSDSARVFKWMLDRVEDLSGNFMTVSYLRDNNQLYPDEIQYTGHTLALTPFASVKFEYQTRSDLTENFVAGFRLGTFLRLASVDVKAGVNRLRKYRFSYNQSPETQRSVLAGVTQLGSDGISVLPATNFSYSSGTTNFVGQYVISNHPNDHIGNGLSRIIDINNDGLPDLIRSPSNGWPYDIYINNGHWDFSGPFRTTNHPSEQLNTNNYELVDLNGDNFPDILFGQANSYQVWVNNGNNDFNPPFTVANSPDIWMGNPNVRVMDMNADGFPDLLQSGQGGTNPPYRIFLNNGGGNFTSVINVNNAPGLGIDNPNVRLADFNGDGLIDFIFGEYNQYRIWINNGQNGFNSPVSASHFPSGQWLSNPLIQLADMNGDGLTDLLESESSGAYYIYYNNGHVDFNARIAVSNPPFWPTNNPNVKLVDMNADGLTDAILGKPYQVYLNNGQNGFYPPISMSSWPNADMDDPWNMLVDFNGDGLMDFLRGVVSENPAYRVYPNNNSQASSRPNILVQITNGIGATTNLEYKNSTIKALLPSQYKFAYSPTLFNTVKATTTSVQSQSYRTDYQFKNGVWNYTEREFRGFALAKVIDPDGNYSQTTFAQDDIYKGRPIRQETFDSAGNLFSKSENTWDVQDLGSGIKFVFLKQKDDFLYDGNVTGKRTQEKYFYDESPQLGSMTKAISLGEVDLSSGSDIGSDKRTVETEYLNNTSNWLIGFPKRAVSKDNSDVMVRQSWFYYDGSDILTAPPTLGFMTKQVHWAGDAPGLVNPVSRYTYDSYGNLKTTTDPNSNITTVTYDTTYQLFPLKTKNAIDHEVINEFYGIDGIVLDSGDGYRGLWGQLKSTTDPNAQKGRKTYDTFGRVTATVSPLDSINFPTSTIEYEFASSYVKIKTHSREKTGQPGTIDSAQFYDGLGRLIQTKSESKTAGQFIVSGQSEYNSRGLPVKKYFSFFSSNSIDSIDPISPTTQKTTLLHDAMGRVVQTTNPDGTYASASYDDWETSAVNENGHKQKSIFDAYGRLIRKEEYTGADGRSPHYPANAFTLYAQSHYEYDSEGNLTRTQDAAGNFTAIAYDKLGRKISLNDPDMGTWQYAYDAAGNLKSQTDAKGRKIDFNYDALNRLSNKNSIGGLSMDLNVDYTYDEPVVTNSKGRLTKAAYDLNGDTKFAYDVVGRENGSTKKIDGFDYDVKRSYDALSRLVNLEFPDQGKVFYTYNAAGQIEAISNSDPENPETITSPIALDSVSTAKAADVNTLSFAHTTSGTNRVLVVSIGTEDGVLTTNIASVSYNGTPLTKIIEETTAASRYNRSSLWYLVAPPAGAHNVVVTTNGGATMEVVAAAVSLTGVKQSTPEVFTKARGTGTSASVSLTTLTNGAWVIDNFVSELSSFVITPNASQTQLFNVAYTNQFRSGGSSKLLAAAGVASMNWTIASSSKWALTAVAFAPAEVTVEPTNFVTNVDYNASGQISRIDFGNGSVTTYAYDPMTQRLNRLVTANVQGATIQDLTYNYDSAGNIVQITDAVNTASQSFEYDALNRLVEASGNYGTKQYAYDPIGNLTLKDGVNYYYGESAAGPHAVSSASDGSVFQYDQNGNMIKKTKGGIAWDYLYDAENRLKEVKKGTYTQAKFDYDGDGGRTKKTTYTYSSTRTPCGKTDPHCWDAEQMTFNRSNHLFDLHDYVDYMIVLASSVFSVKDAEAASFSESGSTASITTTTTKFVGSLYEETSGSPTSHIFLGGTRIASITNGAVMYFHGDHLGGTNLLTNSTGEIKELIEYEPFGSFSRHEKYGTPQEVAQFYFGSKKFDEESGLYFFESRYYNPVIGRFITPDKIVQNPYDSQTLNRYSYTSNNPINRIDPTGQSWFGEFWKDVWKTIEKPVISMAITAAVVFTWGTIAPEITGMAALFSNSGFTITSSAGATTGTLQTHEGQRFTRFLGDAVFDNAFGMKPELANFFGNIAAYMTVNTGFQFGFARLTGANKTISKTKKFDPKSEVDQAIAKEILEKGKGINYGTKPGINPKTGQLENVDRIFQNGDVSVGVAAEALKIGGKAQHLGVVLEDLQVNSNMASFFDKPLKATAEGYFTFGISHTAVNISLLNTGYQTTINSLLSGGWTTFPSTLVYGPYGGGLTGAVSYEKFN